MADETTAAPKKARKKKAPAAKKPRKPKAEGTGHKGRISAFAGKKLYKTDDNPHRPGTAAHNSFSLIRNGMSYEAFRAAGGNRLHLANLITGKYVEAKKE